MIKGFGKGKERGARDDRLIEIEEGCARTHVRKRNDYQVVCPPLSLALFGVKFVGATLHHERLQFLAEGIVQAVMRDESSAAISRELQRALPGASYSISDGGDGRLTVTIRHGAASAVADGFW